MECRTRERAEKTWEALEGCVLGYPWLRETATPSGLKFPKNFQNCPPGSWVASSSSFGCRPPTGQEWPWVYIPLHVETAPVRMLSGLPQVWPHALATEKV